MSRPSTTPTSPGTGAADTQWPRWEVLKQDSERKAHQAVGSVHAAGAEHALLMARTVFARRPAAVSMWVVPAESIHAFTAEELEELDERGGAAATPGGEPRRYLVVRKSTNRRAMTFGDLVGEVEGATVAAALAAARREFADEPILALWLVEAEAVVRSDPADADPWFGPASDKTYKQQSLYSSRATAKSGGAEGAPR